MNVLFVGKGHGSWKVRGIQIARALGAKATSKPTEDDFNRADVIVLVKRAIDDFGERAIQTKARRIWDVLDIWAQPEQNQEPFWKMADAIIYQAEHYGIDALIGATDTMARAIKGVYIPHHSRPDLQAKPVREQAQIVAYEGTPKYLGPQWRHALDSACDRLGLTFVVNPNRLSDADLIVAFRGIKWDGPICRQWKSGVKYVNAVAAGRPVITQPHAAWDELHGPGTVIDTPDQLEGAIREWVPYASRDAAFMACATLAPHYTLDAIARRYQAVFRQATRTAA